MCDGIAEELRGIRLGDKRLNDRSAVVIEALAADPEASINGACDGWGDTLAAYRFFNNKAVTPEWILKPHREATQRRMREHPVVLVVQDTTELGFTKHPTRAPSGLNLGSRTRKSSAFSEVSRLQLPLNSERTGHSRRAVPQHRPAVWSV